MNINKTFLISIILSLTSWGHSIDAKSTENKYAYLYKDLPFYMPILQRPTFPANEVNIIDYGGNPDGIELNTEAFEKAFQALAHKGGGKLIVPSGIWFTGPIVFQSNINLHLEKGALILFSPDQDLYPLVSTSYEGLDTKRCQSPISGRNLENIAITGQGTINGSGEAWRPLKKDKITEKHWDKVIKSGGVLKTPNYWFPSQEALHGDLMDANTPKKNFTEADWQSFKKFLRPVMVSFIECKNILLEGVLFENSPAWNIHPLMCENVILDNIFVRNPGYAQNGDGLDLESCVNSIIVDSTFDVGDDAICIKSGKNEDGRKRNRPTENVIVHNCRVFQGHGGFVVGSEMSGGVKNISVSDCQFLGTDVGLRFKAGRGRGGIVENIHIKNINMFNIATEALLFDLYYQNKSTVEILEEGEQEAPLFKTTVADETTPAFKDIYVKNMNAKNVRRAMYFNGLPEMKISNINIENATITSKLGIELLESEKITLKDIRILPQKGPALTLFNVDNVEITDFSYPSSLKEVVKIEGTNTNIHLPKEMKQHLK